VPGVTAYPRPTHAHLSMPPRTLTPTMPDPCAGVPVNPWCPPVQPAKGSAGLVVTVTMTGCLTVVPVPVPPRRRDAATEC